MYTVSFIVKAISVVKLKLAMPEAIIAVLAYDSRKITNPSQNLFFALQHQRDGHDFIADAYAQGVRSFVLSEVDFDTVGFEDANFIWVEDSMVALQALAAVHRSGFHGNVIGITGSNGKTIVKEWLYQMLSLDKKCYQSPKSYNSQLGVALSLWDLPLDKEIALIEAGISEVGEMDSLERIIAPNWGIFTSLGTAHREGFVSKVQKLAEKWKLFQSVSKIIAPSKYVAEEYLIDPRLVTWGRRDEDHLQLTQLIYNVTETVVEVKYTEVTFYFTIPFVDQASVENTLTCILVLLEMGYSIDRIQEHIQVLKPLEMRLKLKKGKHNSTIIDDTYSNDLASLQIALDFLAQQNQHPYKLLILSDFEGEDYGVKFEQKLIQILEKQALSQIILVGNRLDFLKEKLTTAIFSFADTKDLLAQLSEINTKDSSILIKGARKYSLEKVSQMLVEKSHDTVLEINLKSLEHNLNQYRSKLQAGVKMMAMVKAFSYGSGSFEVANVLQFNKLDYLTVAFVDEGAELRRAGVTVPIMVLSPHESTFEDLVRYQLEPEIYSMRIMRLFTAFMESKMISTYPIHIKLDTGMHRLGFMAEEVEKMFSFLRQHSVLRVASTFSHLVGAGDPNLLDFTRGQIDLFKELAALLEKNLGYSVLKHICNTSGILHHPEAHLDMVRLGIGLYGFDMAAKDVDLEEVGVLKTTITQIKHLPKTETVGYDRKGVLYRDSVIATVKIGYADGYNRRLGNGVGKMSIHGELVPTVGNICMDMCMLDVTDIEVKEGDEVLVFPDLSTIAKEIGTIPYELLTGISSRVKRVYFYE